VSYREVGAAKLSGNILPLHPGLERARIFAAPATWAPAAVEYQISLE